MKVLCLTNFYPTPGRPAWGTFVRSQMESLRPLGVDFDVLLIRGWESKLNYWRQRDEVRAALRRGYDLVHVHFGLTGALLEGMRTPPVVVSLCGDDLLGRSRPDGSIDPASWPMVWLSKRAAKRAVQVIVKSQRMRAALAPLRDSVVIPNGVDFSLFQPRDRAEARRRLGWDEQEPVALFAANPDVAAKNFPLAEATVRGLLVHGVTARLEAVYDRPQAELVDAMAAADALLFTSWWEGSPNVVKEAMAMNLPIVSVDVGDVREQVQGCEGCVVVERSVAPLVDALRPLMESPRRSRGREHIQELRSEAIAQRVMRVYRDATGEAGAAP